MHADPRARKVVFPHLKPASFDLKLVFEQVAITLEKGTNRQRTDF